MRQRLRTIVGVLAWTALVAGPWLALRQAGLEAATGQTLGSLWQYWTGQRRAVPLQFPQPTWLGVSDPVFVIEPEGLRQVGEVRALVVDGRPSPERLAWVTSAEVLLYPSAPAGDGPVQLT